MDPLSSLMEVLKQTFIGLLVALNMIVGAASSSFASLTSPAEPQPATVRTISTSTSPTLASSSPSTASSSTTSTSTPKTPVKKQPVAAKPAATSSTASAPQTPLLSSVQVNENARASIVNILCISNAIDGHSISGSGVIIDARGIILTNAHIGQYFLLRDYPTTNSVDCTIRTGSPASPMYRAQLIYLPPAWIDDNASQITAEHGVGTGENDYAFLRITSTTNPSGTLPSAFPNIGMTTAADTGDQVLVAGYPAGFLDAQTIEKNLYATSAFTTIGQLYTFDLPTHVDVVSLGGTVVSQGGSSGGAVVRTYDGKLSGLISNSTTGTTTAQRDLRAITIGYINRSLGDAGKGGLVEFLSGNLDTLVANFAPTFASEKQKLVNALGH